MNVVMKFSESKRENRSAQTTEHRIYFQTLQSALISSEVSQIVFFLGFIFGEKLNLVLQVIFEVS